MSPSFEWLLISEGSLTVILVVLLIYRSTLTMHEDDQLFLDESEAHMAKDQVELMSKVNKLTPIVKVLGAVWSGVSGRRQPGGLSGTNPGAVGYLGFRVCGPVATTPQSRRKVLFTARARFGKASASWFLPVFALLNVSSVIRTPYPLSN